jgi:DNA repair photolyase
MIVSASRRTDIPACYPEWFMNRIRDGYFCSVNPFNPKQVSTHSLRPEDVEMIVFWTKNPLPLLRHLRELDDLGYCYYFQFTLNDYPIWLEPGLPPLAQRIEAFIELSDALGSKRVIWRYDPIVLSTETPVDFHIERVGRIAQRLKARTERLTISFLDFYKKITPRLRELEKARGVGLWDIADGNHDDDLSHLCRALKRLALENRLEITTCAENVDLDRFGIWHGSCIDGSLITQLTGTSQDYNKDLGQRKECLCASSVDMGAYNTCRNRCRYCYANSSDDAVRRAVARHLASSPALLGSPTAPPPVRRVPWTQCR